MGVSNKYIAYGLIAVGGIVAIYWLYKNALTEGAQKALSGGISGFGSTSKELIGETLGMQPIVSKTESPVATQQMAARPSPVPSTQAGTGAVPLRGAPTQFGKTPVTMTVSGQQTPHSTAINVQQRTSSKVRPPVPIGRTVNISKSPTVQTAAPRQTTGMRGFGSVSGKGAGGVMTDIRKVSSGATRRAPSRARSRTPRAARRFY